MEKVEKKATDGRRQALARAALVFALVAPVSYSALRLYEIGRGGAVDPSLIMRSTHLGYLWRVIVASWWGITCAAIAFWRASSRTSPAKRDDLRDWVAAIVVLGSVVTVVSFAFP